MSADERESFEKRIEKAFAEGNKATAEELFNAAQDVSESNEQKARTESLHAKDIFDWLKRKDIKMFEMAKVESDLGDTDKAISLIDWIFAHPGPVSDSLEKDFKINKEIFLNTYFDEREFSEG